MKYEMILLQKDIPLKSYLKLVERYCLSTIKKNYKWKYIQLKYIEQWIRILFYTFLQQGCPEPGYDGKNCSLLCPENCQDDQCYAVNKTCLSCVAGYIGLQWIAGTR